MICFGALWEPSEVRCENTLPSIVTNLLDKPVIGPAFHAEGSRKRVTV